MKPIAASHKSGRLGRLDSENAEVPVLVLNQTKIYSFPEDVACTRLTAEWTSRPHAICDLDLEIHLYDERARFVEKLDGSHKTSRDESCSLLADLGYSSSGAFECVKIEFDKISPVISTIALFLEGGKNFSVVNTLALVGMKVTTDRSETSFLPTVQSQSATLFRADGRVRKECIGLCCCILYKDGWVNGRSQWVIRAVMEGYSDYPKGKEDTLGQLVISTVPSLEKFKPRLFGHVRDISNALSSRSLPKLKKSFQKCADGLNLGQFTTVLFSQLAQTHPKVVDELEAAYAVAMIHEMFYQIDYNGDGRTDWDEFTTFCIQTGLKGSGNSEGPGQIKKHGKESEQQGLDEYSIEYGEEALLRDHVLSTHRFTAMMKFVPENRRLFVIPEDSDNVLVMNEKFKVVSQIYPSKIQILGSVSKAADKDAAATAALNALRRISVYDVVYLSGRDLYAFCSSDHALVVCKEQVSMGGLKVNYLQHNKIFHNMLHLKLCWSRSTNLLCSVASDKTIYGWDIDKQLPLFQISRHSDIITDFISLENLEAFVTCSMDKTIVMWSAITRRVKGVFLGHKRGVKNVSYFDNILLSSGFEAEAKTWDITSKEPLGILRGHRQSIAASKLMCDRAETEKDYRAITVDEGGEFRLWDIYIKEKTSEPAIYPTLQVFQMQNPEPPMNQIRFIALPNNPQTSTSYYSDLIAVGTKLLHFFPEKNAKDFIAPTCCVFNDPSAAIMTAVGRNLVKYDITNGHYIATLQSVYHSDITCLCLDGERGRRLFAGCANGDVLILNFMTGAIIDALTTHAKEITSIVSHLDKQSNRIYVGSTDGKIRELEEAGGSLRGHNQVDNPFGEGIAIASVKVVPSLHVIVAAATGNMWGIWAESTLKKIMVTQESTVINAVEVVGASGDKEDLDFWNQQCSQLSTDNTSDVDLSKRGTNNRLRERLRDKPDHFLTLAIAVASGIRIYSIDVRDAKGVFTYELQYLSSVYFTTISVLRAPEGCVNYSMNRPVPLVIGIQLIGVTDDGTVIIWDVNKVRRKSEYKLRRRKAVIAVELGKKTNSGSSVVESILDGFDEDGNFVGLPLAEEGGTISKASSPTHRRTIVGSPNRGEAHPNADHAAAASAAADATISFLTQVPTQQQPRHTHFNHKHSRRRRHSVDEQIDTSRSEIIQHQRTWIAHLDSITIMFPLHEHGCFVTVSLDGYHKVWNIERECLGELPLPNLTEKMKNPPIRVAGCATWKFVLERIQVTSHHREVAAVLLENLRAAAALAAQKGKEDKRGHRDAVTAKTLLIDVAHLEALSGGNVATTTDDTNDYKDDYDRARERFVRALQEPPSYSDDAPPTTFMSREERKEAIKQELLLAMGQNTNLPELKSLGPGSAADKRHRPVTSSGDSVMTDTLSLESSHKYGGNDNLSVGSVGSLGSVGSASTRNSKSLSSLRSTRSLWSTADDFCDNAGGKVSYSSQPAFSESSLMMSWNDGLIGAEEYAILRRVADQGDKVLVYDRSVPLMLMRSAELSANIQMPDEKTVKRAEICFGVQKDMYKNADKFLQEKAKLPKKQIVNSIAMARIHHNVRKCHSMIHVIQSRSHDEVELPKDADLGPDDVSDRDKRKEEEFQMRLRLSQSAALVPQEALARARPLDKANLATIMERFDSVVGSVQVGNESASSTAARLNKKKKNPISAGIQDGLEKKLCNCIKEVQKSSSKYVSPSAAAAATTTATTSALDNIDDESVSPTKQSTKRHLTTRALLPYYKIEDVKNFMETFSKVDEDFSGDLDIDEWVKLFALLSENVPAQQARMIFMKVDDNQDGSISMRELIPIVFNKANKEQMKMIIHYVESELVKKTSTIPYLSLAEMEQLFECYDVGKIGFIPVSVIRERVKMMPLPESTLFDFLDTISSCEDDEMVNHFEFVRMMKPYIARQS